VHHGIVSTVVCLEPSSVMILPTLCRNELISFSTLAQRFVGLVFPDLIGLEWGDFIPRAGAR